MSGEATIRVDAETSYDVIVGSGLGPRLLSAVDDAVARVAIIHPPTLRATADVLREDLAAAGKDAITIEIPDGEKAKASDVAAYCWSVLGQSSFTRTDLIIGLGGGATTDLAGFVAATWLRGVPLIQVPTTLLAMVDAAVGGKTGINTEEGKNLVGAFYPPELVICDLATLATMPALDYISGMAEVVKAGFIKDPAILDLIEADPIAAADPNADVVFELVTRAIQVKADVVSADFREVVGGPTGGGIGRELLNYGHTLAHAIERVEGYRWRHGAAVSVGMVYAAEVANLGGRLPDRVVDRHRAVLTSLGLPITYQGGRWDELLAAMKRDKKTRGDMLRFIVLEDVAKAAVMEGPDPVILVAAYDQVSA